MATTEHLSPLAIEHAVLVRAPQEQVFAAFATPEGFDAWFTTGSVIEPHVGGRFYLRWVDWGVNHVNAEDEGVVEAYEPPHRFGFSWQPDPAGPPTHVLIDFTAVPEGTAVRLREAGYRDLDEARLSMLECAAGWGEALTLAKVWVEHGLRY
jgi:uncharacterized protein YndB with AHSA1/START domain